MQKSDCRIRCERKASIIWILVELARKISMCYASGPVRVLTEDTAITFLFGAARDEYASAYESAWLLAMSQREAVELALQIRFSIRPALRHCPTFYIML